MKLTLIRDAFKLDGIYGSLHDETGAVWAETLEHAYRDPVLLRYEPKLKPGTYTCKLGPHRLHSMKEDFSTYEITGVPGHSNILFHAGNYNDDSDGCVLLGVNRGVGGIFQSRIAFRRFIENTNGIPEFTLEVQDYKQESSR